MSKMDEMEFVVKVVDHRSGRTYELGGDLGYTVAEFRKLKNVGEEVEVKINGRIVDFSDFKFRDGDLVEIGVPS